MIHRNTEKAEALLDRYLNGTGSEPECALIESWYEAIALGNSNEAVQDAQASLRRFRQAHPVRAGRRRLLLQLQWAAAAALITLMASTLLYWSHRDTGITAPASAYHVAAGPDKIRRIQLPDSTVVWLNVNSSLRWSGEFTGKLREVTLEGEAGFEVAHDAAHPFIVHTPDADIRVLGTCFNVETDGLAQQTHIALLRGKVAVRLNSASQKQVTLAPGEEASCSAAEDNLEKHKADVYARLSWMRGGFYARETELRQAVEKLCRRYGYSVSWQTSEGLHKHITVSFGPQPFRDMLSALCYVNHLSYRIDRHTVIIK